VLTGRRAFGGDEIAETLAFILTKEPDWNALPSATPVSVRQLLSRCLRKEPRQRLRDIGDARLELEHVLGGTLEREPASAIVAPGSLWRRAVPWGLASVAGAAFALVLVMWVPWRDAPPAAAVRLEVGIGADASLVSRMASLALSPDGSLLAFVARNSQGTTQLYARPLAELRAVPLAGTVDARNPFFSPDGRWVAFFAGGQLRKVAVTGGAASRCARPPATVAVPGPRTARLCCSRRRWGQDFRAFRQAVARPRR
jgi:serine/threonine-protein kinase